MVVDAEECIVFEFPSFGDIPVGVVELCSVNGAGRELFTHEGGASLGALSRGVVEGKAKDGGSGEEGFQGNGHAVRMSVRGDFISSRSGSSDSLGRLYDEFAERPFLVGNEMRRWRLLRALAWDLKS
jgi:hypothetical protein